MFSTLPLDLCTFKVFQSLKRSSPIVCAVAFFFFFFFFQGRGCVRECTTLCSVFLKALECFQCGDLQFVTCDLLPSINVLTHPCQLFLTTQKCLLSVTRGQGRGRTNKQICQSRRPASKIQFPWRFVLTYYLRTMHMRGRAHVGLLTTLCSDNVTSGRSSSAPMG